MKLIACGTSVTGPRHRDLSQPNQDAMSLSGCRKGWVAVVADGVDPALIAKWGRIVPAKLLDASYTPFQATMNCQKYYLGYISNGSM